MKCKITNYIPKYIQLILKRVFLLPLQIVICISYNLFKCVSNIHSIYKYFKM